MSAFLEAQYGKAEYCIEAHDRVLVFRIGIYDRKTEHLLMDAAEQFGHWTILTPCNPASVALCAHENTARLENLQRELDAWSYRWLNSINRDPAGHWPEEPGAMILDIPLPDARSLALKYGQIAIVHAEAGRAPRLVWL